MVLDMSLMARASAVITDAERRLVIGYTLLAVVSGSVVVVYTMCACW
jgi:hypothetical protein